MVLMMMANVGLRGLSKTEAGSQIADGDPRASGSSQADNPGINGVATFAHADTDARVVPPIESKHEMTADRTPASTKTRTASVIRPYVYGSARNQI